jgi:uncharacterized protein (DUF433 family)
MTIDWHGFISVDPEVHHGEPCINGTRIAVSTIMGSIADGMSVDEILEAYPQLKKESVQAVLKMSQEKGRSK